VSEGRSIPLVPEGLTLLVDVSSLIYRALFSTPDSVRAPDGTPVNAAHGFFGMLARLIVDHDPAFISCATDEDWRPDWRVQLLPSYKSERAEPGSAQEQAERRLAPQLPIVFGFLEACGIKVVGHAGYEAEDVIGTLAQRAPGRVAIVSGDRDLFQLVRDPDVYVLFPKKGVSVVDIVTESYIENRYKIPGRAYKDYAVLRGDPSDGLPGVRGIGDKLAASLLARHGSLEAILSADNSTGNLALGKVHRSRDYVTRAMQVVTIPTDLPIPPVDLSRPQPENKEALLSTAKGVGLEGAVRRLLDALG
jgi:5'-3' exonuclease